AFEDREAAQARQAVGPVVESRTKDDELLGVFSTGGRDRIIDEPGACDHGGTDPRPPVVDEPRDDLPKTRHASEPGPDGVGPRQERPRQRILEEPSALRQRRFERAEERVLLRSATCVPFPHGPPDGVQGYADLYLPAAARRD